MSHKARLQIFYVLTPKVGLSRGFRAVQNEELEAVYIIEFILRIINMSFPIRLSLRGCVIFRGVVLSPPATQYSIE